MPDETDVPAFELPDWGTEGAPPPPAVAEADEASTRGGREVEIELAPSVVLSTVGLSYDQVLGLVTAEGAAKVGDQGTGPAAAKARRSAMERLIEEADAEGADAVTGIRLAVATDKRQVTVIVYGTAVRLTR